MSSPEWRQSGCSMPASVWRSITIRRRISCALSDERHSTPLPHPMLRGTTRCCCAPEYNGRSRLFLRSASMKRLLVIAAAATVAVTAAVSGQTEGALDAQTLKGLELRSVGPALATGRVQDVEIDPRNPSVWYVATAFGWLWKTTNR